MKPCTSTSHQTFIFNRVVQSTKSEQILHPVCIHIDEVFPWLHEIPSNLQTDETLDQSTTRRIAGLFEMVNYQRHKYHHLTLHLALKMTTAQVVETKVFLKTTFTRTITPN